MDDQPEKFLQTLCLGFKIKYGQYGRYKGCCNTCTGVAL